MPKIQNSLRLAIEYLIHILYVPNYANLILSPLSPILPFYFRSSTGQTDKKKTKTPDPIEEQRTCFNYTYIENMVCWIG